MIRKSIELDRFVKDDQNDVLSPFKMGDGGGNDDDKSSLHVSLKSEQILDENITKSEQSSDFNDDDSDASDINDNDSRNDSLPKSLQILFGLNGATLALPSLALLSLLNDRVRIPPTYLPAYGAIAFLPYSLKPLYATVSYLLLGPRPLRHSISNDETTVSTKCLLKRHELLGGLLVASSCFILGTGFLPEDGVTLCFAMAFGRGVFNSWAEFLLGLSLIKTARYHCNVICTTTSRDTYCEVNSNLRRKDVERRMKRRKEELLSMYQSRAATCRNIGSLGANLVTFFIFLYRHFALIKFDGLSLNRALTEQPLSQDFVTALFVITSMLPLVGSVIAHKFQVGTFDENEGKANHDGGNGILESFSKLSRIGDTRDYSTASLSFSEPRRDEQEEVVDFNCHLSMQIFENSEACTDRNITEMDKLPKATISPTPNKQLSPLSQPKTENDNGWLEQHMWKYDIAALVFLQSTLIVIGLKHPIISVTCKVVWDVFVVILLLGLAFVVLYPYCCRQFYFLKPFSSNYDNYPSQSEETSFAVRPVDQFPPLTTRTVKKEDLLLADQQIILNEKHAAISYKNEQMLKTKLVAIYLTLRHAMPSPGFLLSSFFYDTIFHSAPLYLQTLSILGSVTAVLSTWAYGRYISKRFSSLKGITIIIGVMTSVSSLWSLLYLPLLNSLIKQRVFNLVDDFDDTTAMGRKEQREQHTGTTFFWLVITIQLVSSFIGELSFMPSVVLATTATCNDSSSSIAKNEDLDVISACSNDSDNKSLHFLTENDVRGNPSIILAPPGNDCDSSEQGMITSDVSPAPTATISTQEAQAKQKQHQKDDGIQYGILISCIDFGDQINDWIAVSIVSALDIRRDNDWENLDRFVCLCAICGFISILFLKLLWIRKK